MTSSGKKMIGATSKYVGVSASKRGKYRYYQARIRINGKSKYLGNYPFTKEGERAAAKRVREEIKKDNMINKTT